MSSFRILRNFTSHFIVRNQFHQIKNVQKPLLLDQQIRNYAKGKDKKKDDKGKHKKNVEINEAALNEVINFEKVKIDMENSIMRMKDSFVKHLSLRTMAGSVETINVVYEGKKYTLMELGQVIRNNPKTISINMSAFPQAIPAVLKALSQSGMNLNPQQDGTSLFLPVPKVTREYRETLAKNAKAHYIKCRDGIKDTQNRTIKSLKSKEKEGLSEDVARQLSEQIKVMAEKYIGEAEEMLKRKQSELISA